jgi:hypothetical protein
VNAPTFTYLNDENAPTFTYLNDEKGDSKSSDEKGGLSPPTTYLAIPHTAVQCEVEQMIRHLMVGKRCQLYYKTGEYASRIWVQSCLHSCAMALT